MHEHVATLPDAKPIVFVVGAFAHGHIEAPWVSDAHDVLAMRLHSLRVCMCHVESLRLYSSRSDRCRHR